MPWVSTVLAPASLVSEHDPFVMPPAPWLKQVERVTRWPTVMLMRLAHRMTRPWMAPVDALRARLGLTRGRHPVFEDSGLTGVKMRGVGAPRARAKQPRADRPRRVG